MDTVIYKDVGGCAIRADVYPVVRRDRAPVIVWIHGGALIGGGRGQMRGVLRELLHDVGFAQVSIDYRLAPETKLAGILEDVRDAFRWVRGEAARYGMDGDRVGVLGASLGGYLTLMCGVMLEPKPKALVSYYGYGDIAGSWYAEPDPFYLQQPQVTREEALSVLSATALSEQPEGVDRFRFYLWCRQQGKWPYEVVGIDPHTDPKAFDGFCPVRNVTPGYPPTLLFHGSEDTDVPWQLSADMAAALAAAGVPYEFVSIPGGGHGFDGGVKYEHRDMREQKPGLRAFYKTVQFFKQYV